MRRLIIFVLFLTFTITTVWAVDFSPTPLKISSQPQIQYDFSGNELSVPFTVSGTPATVIFLVYTKDKANSIGPLKNGYLGWHYVNKVDTCVYVSPNQQFSVGSSVIKWNGKDSDGGAVDEGEYTYYLWGYDHQNSKTLVSRYFTFAYKIVHATGGMYAVTHNEDGTPKTRPVAYSYGGNFKMVIGSDPMDAGLVETTSRAEVGGGRLVLLPENHNFYFLYVPLTEPLLGRIAKYQWVPNGESILQTDWAEQGFAEFSIDATKHAQGDIVGMNNFVLAGTYDQNNDQACNYMTYISMEDGTVEKQVDLSDNWYSLEDMEAGGQANGGPGQLVERNGFVIMSTFCACYREMVNPFAEQEEDFIVWGNGNGDIIGDHNFEENSPRPWICFDFNPAPYSYATDADRHLFSTFDAYDLGAVSFGLIGPDGTGINYYAFAGESADRKDGTSYVDYDSAYDGIYTDNKSTGGSEEDKEGLWFIGHSSFKGIISSAVAVSETAPATFAVSQNSPNPFNPTTTISFSIPEAGNISVDVFNVAGQKIDTISNGFMSAGSHSVIWNASAFSAGVYFYTVKTGNFSKTMKMTLLK